MITLKMWVAVVILVAVAGASSASTYILTANKNVSCPTLPDVYDTTNHEAETKAFRKRFYHYTPINNKDGKRY